MRKIILLLVCLGLLAGPVLAEESYKYERIGYDDIGGSALPSEMEYMRIGYDDYIFPPGTLEYYLLPYGPIVGTDGQCLYKI